MDIKPGLFAVFGRFYWNPVGSLHNSYLGQVTEGKLHFTPHSFGMCRTSSWVQVDLNYLRAQYSRKKLVLPQFYSISIENSNIWRNCELVLKIVQANCFQFCVAQVPNLES